MGLVRPTPRGGARGSGGNIDNIETTTSHGDKSSKTIVVTKMRGVVQQILSMGKNLWQLGAYTCFTFYSLLLLGLFIAEK